MTNKIIDLTKIIDENLEIYQDDNYQDPIYSVKNWCDVNTQGYNVSQIIMGTQTGTHIDAPSHFNKDGDNLEKLKIENLIGSYFLVDLSKKNIKNDFSLYNSEKIIFLKCAKKGSTISENFFNSLLILTCKVWVLAGNIKVNNKSETFFNEVLANNNIYLVENLDIKASKKVKPNGTIIALPLNLVGVSGSPCRVIVTYD